MTISAAFAGDPFLHFNVDPDAVVGVIERPFMRAVVTHLEHRRTVVIRGDVGQTIQLLRERPHEFEGLQAAFLPRGLEETYPGEAGPLLELDVAPQWHWMMANVAAPLQPNEDRVRLLDRSETAEISDVLDQANPSTSARPEREYLTWWGYRDDAGQLMSVMASEVWEGRGVHLSGFGTLPEARGQGIGRAMMAAATRWSVEHHGSAHFGVWMDNVRAPRLYRRLGYQTYAEVQMYLEAE